MSSNPFFYGGMIREARYFVGRKAELDAVFAALQHLPRQAQHVNIVGPRRVGKSSLLWRVKQLLPARIPARGLYLSGQGLKDPDHFYLLLTRELQVPAQAPLPITVEQTLKDAYRQGRIVVLLLDELGALLDHGFPRDFFDGLRAWMDASLLAVVVATKAPVADLVRERGLSSPFFNLFTHPVELGPLPADEAEELLERARTCDRPFTAAELAWMKRWARWRNGYHPAKLQLAGYHLYEAKAHGPVDLKALERRVHAAWAQVHPRRPLRRRLTRAFWNLTEALGRFGHETLLRKEKGATSQSTLRLTGALMLAALILLAAAVLGGYVPWSALLARWLGGA